MSDGAAASLGYTGLEKRESPRFVLLLRPAKVITRSGEYLCILRDVATKGVRLKLFHPLPPEAQVVLELSNGDRYEVEKLWERDGQAGFSFTHPTQLEQLLEERSRFQKRPVRVRLEVAARLTAGGVTMPATLRDFSQYGGRIECNLPLAINQRLRLEAVGLPGIDAKVRWRRSSQAGLSFEQTFKLDELARHIALIQPFGPAIPEEEGPVFNARRMG